MPTRSVAHIADLAIGHESESSVHSQLEPDAREQFAQDLGGHTEQLTNPKTIVCIEDRGITATGTGEDDPVELRKIVHSQWAGGMTLATTKAALAANAAFLRDARSFTEAYLITDKLLRDLDYEDGGHANCGASGLVQASVENPVAREIAIPTIGAIIEVNNSREALFDKNAAQKRNLVGRNFFADWTPAWHEAHLQQTVPQNFTHIKTANDASHGHYGQGLYVMTQEGVGFAKNGFIEDTGQLAFAATVPKVAEVAYAIGGSDEERERILMGFAADLLDVSDKILAPGFPAFKQAA